MRKSVAILGVVLAFGTVSAWAGQHRFSHRGGAKATTCEEMNVHMGDGEETYRSQETFTMPAGPLEVMAARNGGVSLLRSDSGQYEVQVCKFAAAENESAANQIFGQIQAERGTGKLSIRGPQGEQDWTAHLIIRVPANSTMTVQAQNGPLSARDVSGNFTMSTVNGPLSVKNVSGKLSAKAKNGPISVVGDGGDLNVETQNGPISIDLQSKSWNGGKLDASAHNGPVSLNVPMGYQSGVVLTTSGHSPMSCKAAVCNEARKTWDDNEKRIEFGPAGNQVIHISTVNGPVSVGSESEGEL